MSEKKGLFGIFKGWGGVTEEEKQQRSYAISQQNTIDESSTQKNTTEKEAKEFVPEPVSEDVERYCVDLLQSAIETAGFLGVVQTKRKDKNRLHLEIVDSGDDAGRIIGKNGTTLEAFQLLIRHSVIRQFSTPIRIQIDAGDYRDKRFEQLKADALALAETVARDGGSAAMSPMPPTERRHIHLLFENDDRIDTTSEGEGRSRHVVLMKRDHA